MIYPDFYEKFQCKADRCAHTCCVGWEIDIDEKSAERYRTMAGETGEFLRRSACLEPGEGEVPHFIMIDDRCPLLTEKGLCRLILEKSEDELCDICALHPRFFGEVSGVGYAGLGLCCERVCELLLESDERLGFTGNEDELKEFPKIFRAEDFKYLPEFTAEDVREMLEIMAETEPINEDWSRHIEELRGDIAGVFSKIKEHISDHNEKQYDRIYSYIFYRQLEKLDEYDREDLDIYALLCTDFVFLEAAVLGDTAEALRRFSDQIEYCVENVDLLLGLNKGYSSHSSAHLLR